MIFTKFFQKYISNIFISIVQEDNEWIINSKVIKKGVLIDKLSTKFDVKEPETIPLKMQEYLNELQTKYNFAYIALFLDSMGQGAIEGTTAVDFKKSSVDIKSVTHFALEKSWSIYASFIDINWTKKLFSHSGIDFIYSPFIVQYSLIKKQRRRDRPMLYILNLQDSLTITVFDGTDLLFGAFFKTTTDSNLYSNDEDDWESAQEEESVDDVIGLESMDDDIDMEELDDLTDIDELESDENSDFEGMEDDEDGLESSDGNSSETGSDLELFGRDTLNYKYLTSSIHEFYSNSIYRSSFIDTIVIYDGYEVSSDLIDLIEGDLFMDIEMNKININEIICDLAKQEVFS